MTLLLAGITVSSRPAQAEPPVLGPMTFLPGDATIGPAAGSQISPAVARGTDTYLAVWQDDRGGSQDIYATRLDASGNPIDACPIALTQGAGTQRNPRVAWNGTNWLVAWESQLPTLYYYSYGVQAVRVSPQGQILDPVPITAIAYQNSSSLMYSLASDGTNWAVVSEGTSAGEAAIRGARIAPEGTVLDPGGVQIVPETYFLRFGIELGGVAGEYLLVWNEWRSGTSDDILAYRLNTSLQRIEATPFVIAARPNYDMNAKIASNGSDFFVAWNYNDNYLSSDVYGARVAFGGQVLDPGGKAFSSAGPGYGRNPSVTWDGVNWIASWPNYVVPGLNAGRMSTAGIILDPGGVSMPSLGWGSIAGTAGGGLMTIWSDATGGSQDVYAAPVSGSLAPGVRVCASLGAPRQTALAMAGDGSQYLAVFLSARSAGNRVLGQRLGADGSALDPEPFEIAGPAGNYSSPSVAWNGTVYLVTWVSQTKSYARRVAADGSILDPAPILVMNAQESAVAAQGDLFLVVGNFAPTNPEYVLVFGTRIRGSDGAKLDSSPIGVGGSFSLHPKVAPLGSRWFVVWEQHPTHDDPHASVVGNFVDAAGIASTAFGVGGMAAYNLAPAIAARTDTALVAWSESRLGFNNLDIYGRRILANGTLLDAGELALSTAPNSQTLPALAWDGSEFVALFQDPRNIPTFFDEHLDVYGTRASTSGLVQDPAGFALTNDPMVSEIQPATAGGGGRALLGCAAYRTQAPYAAFRAGLRQLNPAGTSVARGRDSAQSSVRLSAAPNPSASSFELRIQGAEGDALDLSILDVTGREIAHLFRGAAVGGEARVIWDGRDARGHRVSPGLYFAQLRHGEKALALKLAVR